MSSENIMGTDELFSVGERSFIQNRKSKSPEIVPQSEQVLWVKFDDFISIFYFLSVT
jgi:hypothetical protein